MSRKIQCGDLVRLGEYRCVTARRYEGLYQKWHKSLMTKQIMTVAALAQIFAIAACRQGSNSDGTNSSTDLIPKISGSCVNIDTETDEPIVFVTDPKAQAIYIGTKSAPIKYQFSSLERNMLLAELKDPDALEAFDIAAMKLRINLNTGRVETLTLQKGEDTTVQNEYQQSQDCDWYSDSSYDKTLRNVSDSFKTETPEFFNFLRNVKNENEIKQNDPYPYTAILNCSLNAFQNSGIPLMACMSNDYTSGSLKVRSGGALQIYKGWQIQNSDQYAITDRGLEIPLARDFSIEITNYKENLLLSMKIVDNDGFEIYQGIAEKYETLQFEN